MAGCAHSPCGPVGLVKDLGATYHSVPLPQIGVDPDIVIECNNGIACLTGVSSVGAALAKADRSWLARLVTRHLTLDDLATVR